MNKVAQSKIYIGREKLYNSYQFKTSVSKVIQALVEADCPATIIKDLEDWASLPEPNYADLKDYIEMLKDNKG